MEQQLPLKSGNLVNALLAANRRSPSAPAVEDGTVSLTYRSLTRLSRVFRDVVLEETKSKRVGIMLPASSAFPAALFGALWADRTAVSLNFLLNPEELAGVIRNADLDVILSTRHFAAQLAKLPARAVFLEDLSLKRRVIRTYLRRSPAPPRARPDDTAVMLYTSGTTAEPKGVELTHDNLYSNCLGSIEAMRVNAKQRFLNILPPFHVFGLTACVLIPIVIGASVHSIPRFNPLAVIKAVREKKITVLLAIPSMYAAMLRTKSTSADAFQSITLAISGGEPLPESVRLGFEQRFGLRIHQGYGLTETSPVVSVCTDADDRPGAVGRLIRDVNIRMIDLNGKEVAVGEEGEIFVKGPGVMKGYYRKPVETAAVLDKDGWFRTGDLGRIDADGFLSITGRVKELLIIGGENVAAREIEAVLESHPSVLQVAVLGIPDELRGEVAVAFVIPKSGETPGEADLRNFAKQSLAGFKVPRRIIIRDDLPRGPTGKIVKRRLRELL